MGIKQEAGASPCPTTGRWPSNAACSGPGAGLFPLCPLQGFLQAGEPGCPPVPHEPFPSGVRLPDDGLQCSLILPPQRSRCQDRFLMLLPSFHPPGPAPGPSSHPHPSLAAPPQSPGTPGVVCSSLPPTCSHTSRLSEGPFVGGAEPHSHPDSPAPFHLVGLGSLWVWGGALSFWLSSCSSPAPATAFSTSALPRPWPHGVCPSPGTGPH